MERCKEKGMLCFSSPFDFTAVDFLEELNIPAYKIASSENIDINLIKKVARTLKPVIISTGMASVSEMNEAVEAIRSEGNNQIVLLKCTSTYPATPENTNILTISHMRELFNCEIGLSDHTMGIGVDARFSMEPAEMTALVIETERAWQALGKISYWTTESEMKSVAFRRSLYIVEDMKSGDRIDERNVRSIRPGYELPPKYLHVVIGKKINRDAKRGTALKWDMIG